MPLTAEQRQAVINDLVTNCDCWKHKGNRELLAALPDDGLQALHNAEEEKQRAFKVANAAAQGYVTNEGVAYRVDPATGEWQYRHVENKDGEECRVGGGEDDEEDDEMPPPKARKKMKPAYNAEDDDDGPRRPRTTDEWLRNAPAEVQNTFNYAKSIEQREKDKIIGQLLVNVAENERPAHRDRLLRRSLDDLYSDLAMMPRQPNPEELARAAGVDPRVSNRRGSAFGRQQADEDALIPPTIDWQAVGEDGVRGKTVINSGSVAQGDPDEDEQEWLRTAPNHVKAAVQNAMAIEGRERRRLIDEITANIGDDDTERRMRSRLASRSLDELKDLAALAAVNRPQKTNFFGGGGGPAVVPTSNSVNQDDVLPLPVMDWTQPEGKKKAVGS